MISQHDGKHFQWLAVEPEVVQNLLSDRKEEEE